MSTYALFLQVAPEAAGRSPLEIALTVLAGLLLLALIVMAVFLWRLRHVIRMFLWAIVLMRRLYRLRRGR